MIKQTAILLAGCHLLGVISGCTALNSSKSSPISSHTTSCKGVSIKTTSLANYIKEDNARYVTKQTHFYCPVSQIMTIVADEPDGQCIWTVNAGTFTAVGPNPTACLKLYDQLLANCLFYSLSSSIEELSIQKNSAPSQPVKIEGQLYASLEFSVAKNQIQLLKNAETNRFDLIQINDSQKKYLARSYNYRYNKKIEKYVPTCIDVFDVTDGLPSKRLIVQVQYLDIATQ